MIKADLAKKIYHADTDWGQVQRQITLSWGQAARISYRNVTMRLGRAMITGAGIVLGIAFLTSVWTAKVAQEGITAYQAQSARVIGGEEAALAPGAEEAEAEERSRAARQTWLVVMSLLVSAVGITNSMLMSVTERFREIGTMKCLGALDEFIVRLFLIESVVLGLLGSIVGALIGHGIMMLVYVMKERGVAAMMNWPEMLMYMGIALLIGTILSLVAAVPPAMRAAKMPPAAALQTEV
ncbi:MAG: FtsX-like permease family protein [candidate division WS1 bacterium]|jgi:predicted lysophospholipase L1 biosynthesis ABC-type transport system permease subunit|nr:FtsX-like permease family protein [candidate division WS1 bacterium]